MKTFSLTIINPKSGRTVSSISSDELPLTCSEMVDMAKAAIKNGYQAKVWELNTEEPVFEG